MVPLPREAQHWRLKVADVVKENSVGGVSSLWLGSRGSLRGLEAFGFSMLKYAFTHIQETFG